MKERGFTLIELLIVVAIIAILAAIAVPNFLEAQTRAKVSRAKADMRSIAAGIECYAVDWNRPMLGQGELGNKNCCSGWLNASVYDEEVIRAAAFSKLTTPLAYMATVPLDPFAEKGNINYAAGTSSPIAVLYGIQSFNACFSNNGLAPNQAHYRAYIKGFVWALRSIGPLRNNRGNLVGLVNGDPQTGWNTGCTYDPSNGTMSIGWIARTNKGELHQPPG